MQNSVYYYVISPDPAASLAGRWAAKEAVLKAISDSSPSTRSLWKGAGAAMKDIEVSRSESGAPVVTLHNHAKEVAQVLGIRDIKVSISHAGEVAVSQAVAF